MLHKRAGRRYIGRSAPRATWRVQSNLRPGEIFTLGTPLMKTRLPAFTAAAALAAFSCVACSSDAPSAGSGGQPSAGGAPSGSAGAPSPSGGAPLVSGGAGSGGAGTAGGGTGGGVVGAAGASAAGAPASNGGAASAGGAASGGRGGAPATGGAAGQSAGGAGGAAAGSKASAGCAAAASQGLNQWVDGMVMTGGANRPYSVRLPSNYDFKRAYPVIVLLHGCGSGTNNVPMEKATGADAILVRGTGSAADTCWDTSANGADVAFFDAMVASVKAKFCADESRFFVVGYSSGSWLANQLTCIRANVLRGAATVTGGEAAQGNCGGPVARIFIHDSDDTTNVISGSEKARDRQLTQNSCNKSAQPTPVDPSPCQLYSGCTAGYPVEWCQTSGKQHGRQDALAPTTFWDFFKAL